ncbi:hypothetical protein ES703_114066 [subsurface metagenome]
MVGQGASNSPVEEDKYSDVDVLAVIAAKLKAGSVTETTGADGKISVTFASPFASTPVVVVQLEGDVDYYCVITAKSTTGFTVKILKTGHAHSQGNTGNEAAHTHGISFASGAGSSHRHSNPNTNSTGNHRHSHSLTSGAGGSHYHTQGATGGPSSTATTGGILYEIAYLYAASSSGGSPTTSFIAATSLKNFSAASTTHTHTNPNTSTKASHTHSITGYSAYAGTHSHTIGNTGYESSHTHSVSGTSGAGSSHSHSNPNTNSANAGNTLVTTAVTFSYIAMLP